MSCSWFILLVLFAFYAWVLLFFFFLFFSPFFCFDNFLSIVAQLHPTSKFHNYLKYFVVTKK